MSPDKMTVNKMTPDKMTADKMTPDKMTADKSRHLCRKTTVLSCHRCLIN